MVPKNRLTEYFSGESSATGLSQPVDAAARAIDPLVDLHVGMFCGLAIDRP